MNLPDELLSALQLRIKDGNWVDRPRLVTLGADDNFLMLTERHTAAWKLDKYKAVSKLMDRMRAQQSGISDIHSITLHSYRFQSYVCQAKDGTLTFDNVPPPSLQGMQSMISPILRDTKDADWKPLSRTGSGVRDIEQRRPSVLQQRAQMRREWSEHSSEFTAQAKGMKVSLSLSVNLGGLGGLARMLG